MSKMSAPTKSFSIRFRVLTIEPDGGTYKHVSPTLEPAYPLFVDLEVPNTEVTETPDGILLTAEGLNYLGQNVVLASQLEEVRWNKTKKKRIEHEQNLTKQG